MRKVERRIRSNKPSPPVARPVPEVEVLRDDAHNSLEAIENFRATLEQSTIDAPEVTLYELNSFLTAEGWAGVIPTRYRRSYSFVEL